MPDGELEYISLQKATRYCNYSQEYLSLRARQGKLKAIKFGRNWLVKKEWLEEYLGKVEEYNHKIQSLKVQKVVLPPANLPVEDSFPKFLELQFKKIKFPKPALQIRLGFVLALVFVSLITFAFHGRESFKIVYSDISSATDDLSESFDEGIVMAIFNLQSQISKLEKNVSLSVTLIGGVVWDTIFGIPQSFEVVYEDINSQLLAVGSQAADVGQTTKKTFKDYLQWLSFQTFEATKKIVNGYTAANDFLEKNIKRDISDLVDGLRSLAFGVKRETLKFAQGVEDAYQFIIRPWREIPLVEKTIRPQPEEGVVILPYAPEKTAEVKGKLEQAFSDKVEVRPDETGRAGIIKPLIKEAAAQEYLYLIVPVAEQ